MRATEPGQFPTERYEALRGTCGRRTNELGHADDAPLGSPWFACHKSREHEPHACAGWLAVEGSAHLGVRLAVAAGEVPAEALAPRQGWPELHANYAAMAAAMGAPNA